MAWLLLLPFSVALPTTASAHLDPPGPPQLTVEMKTTTIARAADLGLRRVVLHSTEMAVDLYRRVGFIERCRLPVYATAPLHSMNSA